MPTPLTAQPCSRLRGTIVVPGDKSISHRALILAALAEGLTRITGLLQADDVLRTGACLRALGVRIEREGSDVIAEGQPWRAPRRALYCGNAGTGARLLMGAVCGQQIAAAFDGDYSLRGRPMERILSPLREMGAVAKSAEGRLPVNLFEARLKGITYRLPKPSAQVKSAVLLAALGAEGTTVIEEPVRSRDHTERMLPLFGAPVHAETVEARDGTDGRRLHITGPAKLSAPLAPLVVPGDPSSAAFPIVAALIVPHSAVTVQGVLLNPLRVGFLGALRDMGAAIHVAAERDAGGDTIGDVTAATSKLSGTVFGPERAPAMIDEYPILAVAAAFATGTTRFEGLAELRIKESDRLAAVVALLSENGVACRAGEDWLEVDGSPQPAGGGTVMTHHDHRIAMASLVLGLGARQPVTINDNAMIATSFPDFVPLVEGLGGGISAAP